MGVIDYTIPTLGNYPVSDLQNLPYGLTNVFDVDSGQFISSLGSVYPVGMTELIQSVESTNIILCFIAAMIMILTMVVIYNILMQRFKFNRS